MSNYIISCTSTVDLSKQHLEGRDIRYIAFHYSLGGSEYVDDFGEGLTFPDFYARMAKGEMTKTSQPAVGDYVEYFKGLLKKEDKDIIHVCLSSGLSGDYNSATLAASMIREEMPERKIAVIDSLGASAGGGLLVDKLADLRDEGYGFSELVAWAEEHKLEVHHWFFSTDLKYYVRGGRISAASGFVGNILHICPLLNMDEVGHLRPREKVHGKRNVQKAIVEKMKKFAAGRENYADKVYISMSDCLDLAEPVAQMVEAAFPKMKGKVEINWIGTTIGAHTGPGTVALFFWGDKRNS